MQSLSSVVAKYLAVWPLPTPEVDGADAFSLTNERLLQLGFTPIGVTVSFREDDIPIPSSVPPHERAAVLAIRHLARFSEVLALWPGPRHPNVIAYDGRPGALAGTIPACCLKDLLKLPLTTVHIERVAGRKPPKSRRSRMRDYSVRCRFVRQVEGQRRGLQICEERIVFLRASSEAVARTKVLRSEHLDGRYMHSSGVLERWILEEILDVCEPFCSPLYQDVSEVYYRLYDRRMRPEYEWHPSRGSRRKNAPGKRRRARQATEHSR